eukprot:489051-Rhodomonas_salina.1
MTGTKWAGNVASRVRFRSATPCLQGRASAAGGYVASVATSQAHGYTACVPSDYTVNSHTRNHISGTNCAEIAVS